MLGSKKAQEKQWGIKDDGWDTRDFQEIGLMDVLEQVEALKYEIENAQRGSYAIAGDTLTDLLEELVRLSENMDDVVAEIDNNIQD